MHASHVCRAGPTRDIIDSASFFTEMLKKLKGHPFYCDKPHFERHYPTHIRGRPTPLAFEDLDLDTVGSIALVRVNLDLDLVCFDYLVNEKDERQITISCGRTVR